MNGLPRWMRRLGLLIRRPRVERAMNEEIQYHLDRETAERVAAGEEPELARLSVLRDFGGVEQVKEAARDARGVRPLEDLASDVRYGARVLKNNPTFTVAAVLTFALGCGASSAVLSVVYGVLLRPLPYHDPASLVVVWDKNDARSADRNVVSVADFNAWREGSRTLRGLAALVPRPVTLTGREGPERLVGAEVSPGYFTLLGVAPALGRDFTVADGVPHAAPVIVLSDVVWRSRFAADPHVVGRTLSVSGTLHTIVGVMPAHFEPPRIGWLSTQDLWLPFQDTPEHRSWGRFLIVVGRKAQGFSLSQVRAEILGLSRQRAREDKDASGWSATVVPLMEQVSGEARTPLLIVLCAVGLLLVIAVMNVGTLSESLARRRAGELATRRTLGASEGRLFRQLLTQSLLVGLLGAGIALLTAPSVVRLLVWLAPASVPRLSAVHVDGPVVAVTTIVALVSTLLFGTLAAIGGRRQSEMSGPISLSGARVTRRSAASTLVVVEIAVALALTTMAALMAQTFASLRSVDLGFRSADVMAMRISEGGTEVNEPAQRLFFAELLNRVRALPGVESAGTISTRPFGGLSTATTVRDRASGPDAPREPLVADVRMIGAGTLSCLRIPLLRGAGFVENEAVDGSPRTVLSAGLAAALWPNQDPIGRSLHIDLNNGIDAEIIGVVPDQHLMDPRTPARATVYLSDLRYPSDTRDLLVRAKGGTTFAVGLIRNVVARIDPGAAIYRVEAMPQLVDEAIAGDRFTTSLLGAFAGLALALCVVGIVGVVVAETTSRRREIGIRLALGASHGTVVAEMVRSALVRATIGVACGVVLGLALARAMKGLLFGVAPGDPLALFAPAGVVAIVVVVASLVPTLRAVLASPLFALREN
jgi:putative ABC transport system permease protein